MERRLPAKDSKLEELRSLMVAYQGGDREAFEALYLALKGRLFNYLLSLSLNRTRAEDLLQECFFQIHRSRRTYQPPRPVLPWAFSIARHVFLMDRRARLRRQKHESETDDVPEIPVPPAVDRLADTQLIRKALAQLAPERREALLLHHLWGMTFQEIGAVLGIRSGTAKVRAHRGMQSLRRALGSPSMEENVTLRTDLANSKRE